MATISIVFTLFLLMIQHVIGDYQCVCSKHAERYIYSSPSTGTMPVTVLYANDCKPLVYQANLSSKWLSIQFYHMIGYIEKDSDVYITQCQGQIPDEDKASTMFPPPIPTSTPVNTNPTSANCKSTTQTSMSPSTLSYQSTPSYVSRMSSRLSTVFKSTASYTSTSHTILSGHIELCPYNIRNDAHFNGYLLAQNGHSCYEFCHDAVSWSHAESICNRRGNGHLVTINDQNENQFLKHFINTYFNRMRFWIGINDRTTEGHFSWSSGQTSTFRHWSGIHHIQHNMLTDCVVILPNGVWADSACGSNSVFTEYIQTRHEYICEYGINIGAQLVG